MSKKLLEQAQQNLSGQMLVDYTKLKKAKEK